MAPGGDGVCAAPGPLAANVIPTTVIAAQAAFVQMLMVSILCERECRRAAEIMKQVVAGSSVAEVILPPRKIAGNHARQVFLAWANTFACPRIRQPASL